jgi:vitamin B12 transporter
MNKRTLATLMAAILSSHTAQAAEASNSYLGQEVVVSATRTMNKISDAGGSSLTVITSKEIKESGQSTVEEVLKGSPGIDVSSNGGPGTSVSIYLRGADPKYTLVLVDGIPFNDPAMMNAEPNLSNMTVDNIERIEIVRGPVSMLYGSSAEAGVINIITKKGTGKPSAFAGIEGGAYHTYRYYGGASGKQGPLDFAVTASRLKTDGFSSANERNPALNPTGKAFEKDGYDNKSFSGNFGLKLDEHVSLQTSMQYTSADNLYDSSSMIAPYAPADAAGFSETSKQFFSHTALKMDFQPLLSELYYNANDQIRDYATPTGNTNYHGHLYEIGWQGDYAVTGNNTVTVGLDSRKESMTSTSVAWHGVTSNSFFVQDQWHLGFVQLVEGIRFEDNEQFGSKTTWRLAPSLTFGDTTIKFSYGTGFKAPSLFELYAPIYGNLQLKAETSKGWDAGVEQKITQRLKAGSTYFRTDYDNRIEYVYPAYTQVPGTTKTLGVENFVEWKPANTFFVTANYTWLHTSDAKGVELMRRPKNKIGLNANWKPVKKLTLNAGMQWVSTRTDIYSPTGKLDSYFLANLAASYKLSEHVELYGRIDNLFDANYELSYGYGTPARSAYAGVKVGF